MDGDDDIYAQEEPHREDPEVPQLMLTMDELIARLASAPPPGPGVGPITFQVMLSLHAGDYDDLPWDGDGVVAADAAAMAALPETTVGEGETEEEAECAVCLEAYEAGDALRTRPCSHGFHERCIFRWLRISRLCPLCRFALPAAAETQESLVDD